MNVEPYDFNLRHLRAISAIHNHGSISAAAKVVNLSQPALTQGIAKIEKQLGYSLFERRSRGMVVTPTGHILVLRIEAAIKHLARGAKGLNKAFQHPDRLITMTQIRAFIATADAGSFIAAARMTGLSQTAIHRAVGDLEYVAGLKLIERRGQGLWLNNYGKKLALGARLAVAELNAAISDIGLEVDGETISIGASPLSRTFLVPAAMAKLIDQEPKARINIVEGSWRELTESLREGVIDMIVGAVRPSDIADLDQIPLYEDRLVIAAGKQHPLAGTKDPSIDMLSQYPWIVGPANSPLRAHWERLFKGHKLPPSPIDCGSVMIIGRLLTDGNYLTLLSPDQVALQIRSGLLVQIGEQLDDTARIIGVSTRKGWRPTILQRQFTTILTNVASTMKSPESLGTEIYPNWR